MIWLLHRHVDESLTCNPTCRELVTRAWRTCNLTCRELVTRAWRFRHGLWELPIIRRRLLVDDEGDMTFRLRLCNRLRQRTGGADRNQRSRDELILVILIILIIERADGNERCRSFSIICIESHCAIRDRVLSGASDTGQISDPQLGCLRHRTLPISSPMSFSPACLALRFCLQLLQLLSSVLDRQVRRTNRIFSL